MNIKLPKWLYMLLPYLHMATGALVLYEFKGWIAGAVGCMLIISGVTIWMLREDYHNQHQPNGRISRYDDSQFDDIRTRPTTSLGVDTPKPGKPK